MPISCGKQPPFRCSLWRRLPEALGFSFAGTDLCGGLSLGILADDRVWFDAAHKVREICREIQISSEAGQRVLLLAHFAATLAAVEAQLCETGIPHERFTAFDFDQLCAGPPVIDSGTENTASPIPGSGRVWLGLARSFQAANAPARQIAGAPTIRIIIAEHHPRHTPDLQIVEAAAKLRCESQISFHISLDDPLLQHFGGASLRPLLEKLGLGEGECISHPLITRAIRGAQQKIDKTVQRELPVESIGDWFKYNLPANAR